MNEASGEEKVLEIIRIVNELHEAAHLTAFLNGAAIEIAAKGYHEKEMLGLQLCFFDLEKRIEAAADRVCQLKKMITERGMS